MWLYKPKDLGINMCLMQGTKYHCGIYVHTCIYVYNDTDIINTHRHSHTHTPQESP